jgi:hypothetical protein
LAFSTLDREAHWQMRVTAPQTVLSTITMGHTIFRTFGRA